MDDAVEELRINTFVQLPTYMREANRGLFNPRVLSIGPYHRDSENTRNMEAHKDRFLHGFFLRVGNVGVQHYTDAITFFYEQTLKSYSGNVDGYTVDMLTNDGCFIIELLLQWKLGNEVHVDNHMRLMSSSIYYDLLLADNQIPFYILVTLFDKFKEHNQNTALNDTQLLPLVVKFFNHEGQFSWANANPPHEDLPDASQVRHLLDLQYKLVIGNNMDSNIVIERRPGCPFNLCGNICPTSSMPRGIPGAKELHDYGIMFRVNADQGTKMFNVTFQCKTMKVPRFEINFGSKILFANLFAYDQITASQIAAGQQGNHRFVGAVTSYVVLMNALINTREDVVVLQREGILDNLLSNEEEVASFFNELGRCALVDVGNHRYTAMFNDVNKYWRSTFNCCKYLVIFRTMHFKNPWTCLSLLGAIMLIAFSCTTMFLAIIKFRNR